MINASELPLWMRLQAARLKRRFVTSNVVLGTRKWTGGRRLEPSFLIVGAEKAGSTFLHSLLAHHPDIRIPWTKEIHYFDDPDRYALGESWYRAFFPLVNSSTAITFESTPNYMFYPLVAERIAKALPNVKVIMVLRDPVERAFSHYKWNIYRRHEPLSFRDAIEQEEARIGPHRALYARDPQYKDSMYGEYSYRERGLYLDQLLRFERFFPKENILAVESGRLFRATQQALAQVEGFLKISDWEPDGIPKMNAARVTIDRDEDTMTQLREFYRPYNQALYEHLGWDPAW